MTATESPWSNGLVERHNGVLGNIVRKMMSGKPNCSLETGVAWSMAAKNSLKNVYEFSPNFWKKIQLPLCLVEQTTSLERCHMK